MKIFSDLSLTARLYLGLILSACVVVSGLFFGFWWSEKQSLESMLQQNGSSLSVGLSESLALGLQLEEPDLLRDAAQGLAASPNVDAIDVYTEQGKRLLLLGYEHAEIDFLVLVKAGITPFSFIEASHRSERFISPVYSDGELLGYVALDLLRAPLQQAAQTSLWFSLLAAALLLLLFWWLSWLAIRQMNRPLNDLYLAVEAVAKGDFQVTVDENIPEPLGHVAQGFNQMTQALAKHRQELQDYTASLQKSEQRFRDLFTYMPVAMYMADIDGKVLACNPSMAELFGFKDADAMLAELSNIRDLFQQPEDRDALVQNLLRDTQVAAREQVFLAQDGSLLQCLLYARLVRDADGLPIRVEGILQDMTAMRALEHSLVQANKMEAVGQVAAGVAHDFNNLLAMMMGNAELLRAKMDAGDLRMKYVRRLLQAVDRAANVTKNLLGFSRKGEMRSEKVYLAELLKEVQGFLQETSDRRVRIVVKAQGCEHVCVMGDPTQFHQILMNLAINAMHAMPEGGVLTMSLKANRSHAVIDVADTGMGIPDAIKERIFDPFFSTRDEGDGTGLGLAMVQGIVERHQGSVHVESQEGVGSHFVVSLPLLAEVSESRLADEQISLADAAPMSVRALVVDDELFLRELVEEVLQEQSCQVILKDTGEAALAYLQYTQTLPDIVLLDMNMPGMGGLSCLREIRQLGYPVKIIVMTGYMKDTLSKTHQDMRYDGFLAKPFPKQALIDEFNRVLAL